MEFIEHSFIGKILLTIGTITGGLTLIEVDLYLSIFLKLISVGSFVCYLLINQKAIIKGWFEFKNRFRK